ncbi:MAG: hypothetical protein ABJE95_24140 [Byssovorax sp.]
MARITWGWCAMALVAGAATGCGAEPSAATTPVESASPAGAKTIEIAVMSGREQPPPTDWPVALGAPVTLRLVGLGPPKAIIHAPDGSPITTVDAPIKGKTGVNGTELVFTPTVPGVYQVHQADAPTVILARLNAG